MPAPTRSFLKLVSLTFYHPFRIRESATQPEREREIQIALNCLEGDEAAVLALFKHVSCESVRGAIENMDPQSLTRELLSLVAS